MRLLFYFPTDIRSTGGAERYTLSLVEQTSQRGHRLTVLTQPCSVDAPLNFNVRSIGVYEPSRETVEWIVPSKLQICLLSTLWLVYHCRPCRLVVRQGYKAILKPYLRLAVERARPDFIITTHSGLIYSAETMLEVARQLQIPFGFLPLAHTSGLGYAGRRFRYLYRAADRLFALTQHEANWLVSHGGRSECIRVLGGAPANRSSRPSIYPTCQQLGLPDHVPIVLFLGRKVVSKGYKVLLAAMPYVWKAYPSTYFVFVGPPGPSWQADFSAYACDYRVLDWGEVDEETRQSALVNCSLLCVPSVEESFGMVYTEAWQLGKPVIAADIPVTRELIGKCGGGLLVTPEAQAVAKAIIDLLSHPLLAREMGQRGLEQVQRQFTWERVAERFERALLA